MDDFLFDPWTVAVRDPKPRETGETTSSARRGAPPGQESGVDAKGGSRSVPRDRQPEVGPEDTAAPPRRRNTSVPVAARLREMLVEVIRSMEPRLRIAGHRISWDDRLDRAEPIFRFRLVPSYGPLDDPPSVPGSVLELRVLDEDAAVAARFWLDPLAESPEEETSIGDFLLERGWLEDVLLSFVAKTLRRA